MSIRRSQREAKDKCIERMRPIVKEASCKYEKGEPRGLAFIGSKIFEMAMAEKEKGALVPNTVINYWKAALTVAEEMKLPGIVRDISRIVSGLDSKRT